MTDTDNMAQLIILITDANRGAIYKSSLTIEQEFGRESIIVDNKIVAEGISAYVTGEKEDFRQLVAEAGELWTSTNPMAGNWQQYVVDEAEKSEKGEPGQPESERLRHKPAVQRIMDLARQFRSAHGKDYDRAYKAVQDAA